MAIFVLNEQERDCVIAALRLFQQQHELPQDILDIAENERGHGGFLTEDEIDTLIEEKLNSDGICLNHIVGGNDDGTSFDLMIIGDSIETVKAQWTEYWTGFGDSEFNIEGIFRLDLTGGDGVVSWVIEDLDVAPGGCLSIIE